MGDATPLATCIVTNSGRGRRSSMYPLGSGLHSYPDIVENAFRASPEPSRQYSRARHLARSTKSMARSIASLPFSSLRFSMASMNSLAIAQLKHSVAHRPDAPLPCSIGNGNSWQIRVAKTGSRGLGSGRRDSAPLLRLRSRPSTFRRMGAAKARRERCDECRHFSRCARVHEVQGDGEQQDGKDIAYDERQDRLIGPSGTDGRERKGGWYAADRQRHCEFPIGMPSGRRSQQGITETRAGALRCNLILPACGRRAQRERSRSDLEGE
jgi:hypothetical protein